MPWDAIFVLLNKVLINRSFREIHLQKVNTKDGFYYFIVLESCCIIFKPDFDKKLISTAL